MEPLQGQLSFSSSPQVSLRCWAATCQNRAQEQNPCVYTQAWEALKSRKQGMSHSQHAAFISSKQPYFFSWLRLQHGETLKNYRLMFKLPLRLASQKATKPNQLSTFAPVPSSIFIQPTNTSLNPGHGLQPTQPPGGSVSSHSQSSELATRPWSCLSPNSCKAL